MSKYVKYIRTTINIRNDIYRKIQCYSEQYDVSIEDIMKLYIEAFIRAVLKNKKFVSTAMRYQKKYPEWEKPHICFSRCEYDRILDVKKVYRLTLSLLLAMSIQIFGESLLIERNLDSYPIYSYKKHAFYFSDRLMYVFEWIKQEKKEEKT